MKPKQPVPAWTGVLFTLLTFAGINLPIFVVDGRSAVITHFLWTGEVKRLVVCLIAMHFVSVLAAVQGMRWCVFFVVGMVLWFLVPMVIGALRVVSVKVMFQHMSIGTWCCFAGLIGLLLSPFFRRIDDAIHRKLISCWKNRGKNKEDLPENLEER
ncbi:hypothetical protein [uncultured Dysosmobacter sp.]|uniref:hypothetical protein n=1 Tax=uncultured Dysosmobacter sp. TaxID=2591384 RepID=UPI0026319AD1|nr:hypothetical protein [uncultured Dysosmobacter sp.]